MIDYKTNQNWNVKAEEWNRNHDDPREDQTFGDRYEWEPRDEIITKWSKNEWDPKDE